MDRDTDRLREDTSRRVSKGTGSRPFDRLRDRRAVRLKGRRTLSLSTSRAATKRHRSRPFDRLRDRRQVQLRKQSGTSLSSRLISSSHSSRLL